MSDDVAAPPASKNDCTSGTIQGGDHFAGFAGIWLSCTPNKRHTFTVVTDPGHACVNFTEEDTSFIQWIHAPEVYPSRDFKTGTNRVFVFVGLKKACGSPPFGTAPLRACKTAYGWFVEIDSTNTGNYDMTLTLTD